MIHGSSVGVKEVVKGSVKELRKMEVVNKEMEVMKDID